MIDAEELKARLNGLYCKHADNIDFKNCAYQVERIIEDMRKRNMSITVDDLTCGL
ncbi:MAG: hypothetical protein NC409_04125 [Clostridium sp.]|nr:hypothetical protein [Clostridium sp.]